MSEDFNERNVKFLERLKNGEISEDKIPTGVGSYLICIFEDDKHDSVPLLFDFLSWKFDKDYSEECKWVQECLDAGMSEYLKFKEMMRNPLFFLMAAMMECKSD